MAFDIWTAMYFPSSTLEERERIQPVCASRWSFVDLLLRVCCFFLFFAVARVRRRGMESYAA